MAVTVLATGAAFAAEPTATIGLTAETGLKQVVEHKAVAYREVLAAFDAALRAAPDDAALSVARCEFIGKFTDDEYGEWIDTATGDYEACAEALEKRWPDEPVARLFKLDQLWGEEAVAEGEKLLEVAGRWPDVQRRELLTRVSEAHESQDNDTRAGELAVMAVRLGDASQLDVAVKHLAGRKEFESAAMLLAEAPVATEVWRAKARIQAALDLPDRQAAAKELRRYAGAGFEIDTEVAARAYLRAGEVAAARKLLDKADDDDADLRAVRFEAAVAAKDFKTAAGLVDPADMEDVTGNIARFVTLASHSPASLLSPTMLLAAVLCMLAVAAMALIPGLLLVPVHYRGVVRQLRGKPALPLFDTVGMRRAWFGAAVILCVPMVVGMMVAPTEMATVLGGGMAEPVALFEMMLWGTVAGLACIAPALRGMGVRQLLGDRQTLRASWRVLLAWACVFGVAALLGLWHRNSGSGAETAQIQMVDALAKGGMSAYGPVVSLLLVAVLVPVFEEIVFRGLVLGGLTRYISFGWANTLQAALFALSHDDMPRFPFYFVMGLMAGWLVKKTRALGPAIALHILNNTLAFSVRLF